MFVTPHVWAGRKKWADDKCFDGAWADIQVIDGSVLSTWLERAPAVALWIADTLGRSIRGLHSLDRYWDSALTHRYAPQITSALIIGGRHGARDQFIEFLQSPSGAVSLVGETIEEAVVFAAAVCRQSFTSEQRSRLLVLSESAATEHLATLSQEHIVILTDPALYPAVRSDALEHLHFVLPVKRDARANKATASIDLGSLVRKPTAVALQELELSEDDAERIVVESKGSLHAVLWMIAQPESGALKWATGRAASELAPLVLAGQWMANDHPDHEVVAKLAQRDYREIKQTLAEWSGPDKPLDRRGALWDWKAWAFAWTRLAPALQRDDIDRFLKIAKEVLGATDPALELPPEDRWLANIRGKVSRYSSALREGLSQSIVLLAINGDLLPDTDGRAAAQNFVKSLLQVPDPASRWISIASCLPDLAEAAPDAFLDTLDRITDDPTAVRELFTECGMFGSSPHTQVVRALERLAWSREQFGRVVLAFARLAALDPGGKQVNRPWHSLRMFFLPWHPATGASVADRVNALRLLFQNEELVAWRCAASLLPQSHDVGSPFARPKWRGWAKDITAGVSLRDYWVFQEELVNLLLQHAGDHGERWAEILKSTPELCEKHPQLGTKVVEAIRGLDPVHFARAGAYVLGEAARKLVMHHENMHEADWAMKGKTLDTFKQLRDHLRPLVHRDRNRWLFKQWPEVLRKVDLSMDERWEQLRELRSEAVSRELEEEGFDSMMTWANEVENPESLGETLALIKLTPKQEHELLQKSLDEVGTPMTRPLLPRLISGYVSTKSKSSGMIWWKETLKSVREMHGSLSIAFFLQSLPYGKETWALVEEQEDDIRAAYWREIGLHVLTLDECETAIPMLLAANRPFKVIDIVAMLLHAIEMKNLSDEDQGRVVALAQTALNAKIDHLPQEEFLISSSMSYEIDELLTYLEAHGVDRSDLAQWEWYWLPLICECRRGVKALQVELTEDPVLFVELLKSAYRPKNADEAEQQQSDEGQNRAQHAYKLLVTWNRTPGLRSDAQSRDNDELGEGLGPITPAWTGSIDEAVLVAWMHRAIELTRDADRTEICNQHIGRQFAYAPADIDGVWPCAEVRRAIERARSDDIEKGMIIEVYNRRGVHFLGRDGQQETLIANKFREWCERVRHEYPRTGAMLRRLAECYEAEALREIEDGHLEEFRE
ncbi:hypothetical protein KBZ20_17055 [Vulcanococcus limneticus Candia 3F8]|uniref:hypothetical protein n=1 Tax=Vulcanococcus limneticus TaxID=2170428 RepID=UPI000B97DD80|nr:hypothetical protein [Vulcanococcus limneticus]MCP9793464.1 hypothetical protein [Vulcanococcus limneticus MW73D5]MCP9895471.1 hypothetical protein [Vulcanococcus limneticus Candia 3F8]MCP9898825.1 hypothetical protein [Vulcanococcus limneticus Candia 3B3]